MKKADIKMVEHPEDNATSRLIESPAEPGTLSRLVWSLPWLARYPFWRASELARRVFESSGPQHLIFIMANHFEPGWNGTRMGLGVRDQLDRLEQWHKEARATASAVRDSDGKPFRHTNFYPAEQYHRPILDKLAEMQAEDLGEVEVHLHHGVEQPDSAAGLRRTLEEFRDILAEEHKCLSRERAGSPPMYAFVHGNWALANSAGGQFCGVDSEMQILAETGCYADLTLPSIFSPAQVSRINAVYQCGSPLSRRAPHRSGPELNVGAKPVLPILLTGPTVFDWRRRKRRMPVPRVDDGVVTKSYPLDLHRLRCWRSAAVAVRGRPDWTFIKLHCHGFFQCDQAVTIGEPMRRFLEQILELSERSAFTVHFATAREAFNIILAAVDGAAGEPGLYRDYRLRQIMMGSPQPRSAAASGKVSGQLVGESVRPLSLAAAHCSWETEER